MFVVPVLPIPEDASKLFDYMPKWNVVLWTDMIAGYALNGKDEEAQDGLASVVILLSR